MMLPPIPANEAERLAALYRCELLDSLPEQVYDDLTRLASYVCGTPIALVSLTDTNRQWFKSRVGIDVPQLDRAITFCAHVVATGNVLVVPDTAKDGRFADNPLVLGDPPLRFYAGAPLLDPDGFTLGTLCVGDRRPRKLRADQIEMLCAIGRQVMSQIELRLRIAEQKRVAAQLAASHEAKNELVGVVSHELRTPLTSIRGSLGLLDGGALGEVPAPMKKLIEVARSNTDRLVRLINDILDLEKIEAGKLELHMGLLDPVDLVDAAVTEIRAMADPARVRLVRSVEEPWASHRRLLGDRDRLLQVLINLLSNAIKVSPPEGLVSIRIETSSSAGFRIAVRDEGPGIPSSELHRIFGKFQQIDTSEGRPRGGTGLGLAICKAIVEQHAGAIGVQTAERQGSTFWFEIPSHSDPAL